MQAEKSPRHDHFLSSTAPFFHIRDSEDKREYVSLDISGFIILKYPKLIMWLGDQKKNFSFLKVLINAPILISMSFNPFLLDKDFAADIIKHVIP